MSSWEIVEVQEGFLEEVMLMWLFPHHLFSHKKPSKWKMVPSKV
jgi:hypothetical protein